jgi:hypothetical protein
MKIERFNENILSGRWKPTDKVLKVKVNHEFEVLIDDIRDTDKYQQYGRYEDDLFYGLEEWLYTSENPRFDYTLYDGNGNIIEDEDEFDKYIKNVKNYNI